MDEGDFGGSTLLGEVEPGDEGGAEDVTGRLLSIATRSSQLCMPSPNTQVPKTEAKTRVALCF
jgi:hypothetical protein